MSEGTVYRAARLFDGQHVRAGAGLWVQAGRVRAVVAAEPVPAGVVLKDLGPVTLAPGFVDLQVNGGGGVMLNDAPTVATLHRIAQAHARLGATTIMPTLISDTPEVTEAAVAAVAEAVASGCPGIAGLHLEGPHLATTRAGAHDSSHFRPLTEAACDHLCRSAGRLPALMVTLAPEQASPARITRLAAAGITVALGHTEAPLAACRDAAAAGARAVTHLFNAMPPLASRAPGPVAAALEDGRFAAGLIADGVHVDPALIRLALRAKTGPGRLFLVSDAMACAGTAAGAFTLQGRQIQRRNGRLTLADGTLAGADLDLARAVAIMTGPVGLTLAAALAMVTAVPADLIGRANLGRLRPGAVADFVTLDEDLTLTGAWRRGQPVR